MTHTGQCAHFISPFDVEKSRCLKTAAGPTFNKLTEGGTGIPWGCCSSAVYRAALRLGGIVARLWVGVEWGGQKNPVFWLVTTCTPMSQPCPKSVEKTGDSVVTSLKGDVTTVTACPM